MNSWDSLVTSPEIEMKRENVFLGDTPYSLIIKYDKKKMCTWLSLGEGRDWDKFKATGYIFRKPGGYSRFREKLEDNNIMYLLAQDS